ncbi:MAG: S1 RNA-binding domain-containing protein, partial [Candidatus Diapherotrites archaeon]
MTELPEQGEIVIGKITKVLDYGVFLELLEYEGVQGFVHISNVSSSWIKNIRNFVKEGQIRAGKVIAIDEKKNQIDISFTKVPPNAQREKIEEYRQTKRCQKLIEMLAEKLNEPYNKAWDEVAEPLLNKFDNLYQGFQAVLIKPEQVNQIIPKKWLEPLKEIVEKNIEMPKKMVKGRIFVYFPGQKGVETLKKTLQAGLKKGGKNVEMLYEGSGKYLIKSTSIDYKNAEKILNTVATEIIETAKA